MNAPQLSPVTRNVLGDFLVFAESAARLVDRGKDAWDYDEFLRLAAESLLHRIGEAVARIDASDPEFLKAHAQVHWRPMKGMRNIVAHEYGAVDYEMVWRSLKEDLPREADAVRAILDAGAEAPRRAEQGSTGSVQEQRRVSAARSRRRDRSV